MNLVYLLAGDVCATLVPIMTLLGYLVFGIKVVVPVILIVVGMIDLAKAIMGKDDSEIKKAQSSLIKKLVVAICVYLLVTIVGLVMQLIGNDDWKQCAECALNVTGADGCYVIQE